MALRVILCDVYGTLLEVAAPPPNSTADWPAIWKTIFSVDPPWAWSEFQGRCQEEVAKQRQRLAQQVDVPEVDWLTVLASAAGKEWRQPRCQWRRLGVRLARMQRHCSLDEGAAEFLAWAHVQSIHLGICSNAQQYTQTELGLAMRSHGLRLSMFRPDLQFWSYQLGLGKPSAALFAGIVRHLTAQGIAPGDVLMVGDRQDNDTTPAANVGMRTWLLTEPSGASQGSGTWAQLMDHLRGQNENRHPAQGQAGG